MIIAPGFIGIDIAKDHLDVFDAALGTSERIANTHDALAPLIAPWKDQAVLVVFEATGHYDRRLRQALAAAGIAYARINPARARDFARAAGFLAKTDRVDARMLAAFGQCLRPSPHTQADPARTALAEAHKRRDQLVQMRQQERTRRSECDSPALRTDIEAHIAWLDARIAQQDAEIARQIARSETLAHAARRLRTVPGIGPVAATTLLARMPELGQRSPKTIAALAGLAPFTMQSGQWQGRDRIQGGRKRVRDALYMAAVSAARTAPRFRAFYQALRDAGKPPKLALIALARKLITVANAVLRDDTAFQP